MRTRRGRRLCVHETRRSVAARARLKDAARRSRTSRRRLERLVFRSTRKFGDGDARGFFCFTRFHHKRRPLRPVFFSLLRGCSQSPENTRRLMPSPRIPHYSSTARARRATHSPPALGERLTRKTPRQPFWLGASRTRRKSRRYTRRRVYAPPRRRKHLLSRSITAPRPVEAS